MPPWIGYTAALPSSEGIDKVLDDLPLDRRLRLGLEELGLSTATAVQEAVVPVALAGRDVLVSAETGSGKTLCYLLPLAQKILDCEQNSAGGTLALILVPTRELARQVVKHARQLLQKSQLRVQAITGGADTRYQKSLLRKDPEIIVATPGRFLELSEQGSTVLTALQTLVLDEADRMLDMGFRDDVLAIAKRCNSGCQTMLLSATLKHAGVAAVASSLLTEPHKVSIGQVRQAHAAIDHQLILADNQTHKDKLLYALLAAADYGRALVFANKRRTAERLARVLSEQGLRCGCLHGEMRTETRKRVVEQLREGRIDVLCASDVAARGLDINSIGLVVNYDMPHSGDDYLHRSGRTGRAGNRGLAISLVGASEWNLMISIQRYLNLDFQRRSLPGLKARYSGPKKQKNSGKAAGSKRKKHGQNEKKRPAATRSRRQSAGRRGKNREESTKNASGNDGFAPLRRKKRPDSKG